MARRSPFIRIIRDFFEKNPAQIQFWLTIIALGFTIWYSSQSLKSANDQFHLAQKQFIESKKLHTEDSISSFQKDRVANGRFIKDTTKQGQHERAQEQRNHLQDALNQQQFDVNKSQLKAIQTQAKIAQSQFYQQQEQYKQQLYEQRPVFFIDSVSITTINSIRSTLRFYFSNQGIRSAHVDSTVLAFYNPLGTCFSVTPISSNQDLILQKTSLATTQINIWDDCLKSNLTVYYLLIYYKDKITGSNQIEPIFFRYEYLQQHRFFWSRVTGPVLIDFKVKLKKKKVFVIE